MIVLVCILLIGALLAYTWLCDKLGIGHQSKPTQVPTALTQDEIAWHYQNYPLMLDIFAECIDANHVILGLQKPGVHPSHMLPPEKQFALRNGSVMYYYVFQREAHLTNFKPTFVSVSLNRMKQIINTSLPQFCRENGAPVVLVRRCKDGVNGRVYFEIG